MEADRHWPAGEFQEPPIIGRLPDKAAGSVPIAESPATIRQVADSAVKVRRASRSRQRIVFRDAHLCAIVANEAGIFESVILSAAKDLAPATHSVIGVHV